MSKHTDFMRSHGSGTYFTSDTLIQLDNGFGLSTVKLRENMYVWSAEEYPMKVVGITIQDDSEKTMLRDCHSCHLPQPTVAREIQCCETDM